MNFNLVQFYERKEAPFKFEMVLHKHEIKAVVIMFRSFV